MKICSRCETEKEISAFGKDMSRPDRLDYWCRECKKAAGKVYRQKPEVKARMLAKSNKWRIENPERIKNNELKRVYGIDLEKRQSIFEKQNSSCAICKTKNPGNIGWVIDHCHKTKIVRGVLCNRCNLLLGRAKDDVQILLSAVEYLEKFQ